MCRSLRYRKIRRRKNLPATAVCRNSEAFRHFASYFNSMKRTKISLLVGLGLIGSQWAFAESPKLEPAPETKKQPVKDSYYDVTVEDDYRWLED